MAVNFVQRRLMCSSKNGKKLQLWAYNLSGFNKYGLMRDDLLDDSTNKDVAEALRRLPKKLYDERNFRILRAVQCSLRKEILPKKQWMTLENDCLYLQPYLKEVIKEREEREEWNKKY